MGDFLRTMTKSRLELTFIDDSVTRLAPLSRLRVTEFLFDADKRTGTIDLLRGKVQSVLVKATPDSVYEVHTPTAVAGVRGTTFFVYFRDGVTGGASREGTFYVYSRGRPDQVRIVRPGQAFLVLGADEIPIVRPATEEELERHLDDTTIRKGEALGDGEDPLNGGDMAGDAESGERYADAADPDTDLPGLDPDRDPMPDQTLPPEPPLPELQPESEPQPEPFAGVNISGTSNYNNWAFVHLSLVASSPGIMEVDGEIHDPSFGPVLYPSWSAPVSIDDGTQRLDGIFAGAKWIDGWFGLLPGFHVRDDGLLGYTLGMLEGSGEVPGQGGVYEFDGGGPADYVLLTTEPGIFEVDDNPIFDEDMWGTWKFSDGGGEPLPLTFNNARTVTWSIREQGGDEASVATILFEGFGIGATTEALITTWGDLLVELNLGTEKPRAYLRSKDIPIIPIGDGGTFEQTMTGSWIDIDDAVTGVLGGMIRGGIFEEREQNELTGVPWYAMAGGIFLETSAFLDMVADDPATLGALNIPFVEVGRTTLSGASEGEGPHGGTIPSLTMDDVRFFSYSPGGAPLIWATGAVTGTYEGNPAGAHGSWNTSDWEEGGFSVTSWDGGSWAADIDGGGSVTGIGNVSILGGAAGSYAAGPGPAGTFEGTASGVVVP
jgi:hypothetical protein